MSLPYDQEEAAGQLRRQLQEERRLNDVLCQHLAELSELHYLARAVFERLAEARPGDDPVALARFALGHLEELHVLEPEDSLDLEGIEFLRPSVDLGRSSSA